MPGKIFQNTILLIGKGQFLLECCKYLFDQQFGFTIITTEAKVLDWAKNNKIKYYLYIESLPSKDCWDYLFSIQYEKQLGDEILSRIECDAFNYHDSLLPKYAGMNATVWALLNREVKHGVTWHKIINKLDAGAIIYQEDIKIDPSETSASLNLKCFSQAFSGFKVLISKIKNQEIIAYEFQELNKRSFYSKNDKPTLLGYIDLSTTFGEIDSLVRALQMSGQRNLVAKAKLLIDDKIFYIKAVKIIKVNTSFIPNKVGDVLEQSDGRIKVQHKEGVLVFDLEDKGTISLIGKTVFLPAEVEAEEILAYQNCFNEEFWRNELNNIFLDYPPKYLRQKTVGNAIHSKATLDFNCTSVSKLIAAISIYFYRCSSNANLTIGYISNHTDSHFASFLIENIFPLNVFFGHSNSVSDLEQKIAHSIKESASHKFFLKDLSHRMLDEGGENFHYDYIPVAISPCVLDNALFLSLLRDRVGILVVLNEKKGITLYSFQYPEPILLKFKEHLENICSQVFDADADVLRIEVIPNTEREIVTAQNSISIDIGNHINLPEAVLNSVTKYPGKIAVIEDGFNISYKELWDIASSCAQELKNKFALGKSNKVGIFLEKGWKQVVACLAINMAGGVFIPLNTKEGELRLEKISKSADIDIVITDCDTTYTHSKICLTVEYGNYNRSGRVEIHDFNIDDLAYVIYTSGSTGEPKGVMVSHHNVLNTICVINKLFDVDESDRSFAISELHFDLAIYDIFGPLIAGGAIVYPAKENMFNFNNWLKTIVNNQVTIWNSVPSILKMALEHYQNSKHDLFSNLRLILLSGDWLPLNLAKDVKMNFRGKFISLGGATECSIWSNYFEVQEIASFWESIPYGKPLPNQQFYILDEIDRKELPFGVIGELYIAGDSVSKGYLNNESISKKHFSNINGHNLYRTLDYGYYDFDGKIIFVGRRDRQIKLHGYRIELNEIEYIASKASGVSTAVVIPVVNKKTKSELLVLFVLLCRGCTLHENDLRRHIKEGLPEYMRPEKIVPVENLPLTRNDKIDYKKLEEMALEIISHSRKIKKEVIFNDKTEKIISVLSGILKIQEEDIEYDLPLSLLGVDSIKIIEMVNALDDLGFSIKYSDIYRSGSLLELAKRIEVKKDYPIEEINNPSLSLSQEQQGMIFVCKMFPGFGMYVPSLKIKIEGDFDKDAFIKHFCKTMDKVGASGLYVSDDMESLWRAENHINHDTKIHTHKQLSIKKIRAIKDQRLEMLEDIDNVPLYILDFFEDISGEIEIIFTFHHLLFDGPSIINVFKNIFFAMETGHDLDLEKYSTFTEQVKDKMAVSYYSNLLAGCPKYNLICEGYNFNVFESKICDSEIQNFVDLKNMGYATSAIFIALLGKALQSMRQESKICIGLAVTQSKRPENSIGAYTRILPVVTEHQVEFLSEIDQVEKQIANLRDNVHLDYFSVYRDIGVKPGEVIFDNVVMFDDYSDNLVINSDSYIVKSLDMDGLLPYPLSLMVRCAGQKYYVRIRYSVQHYTAEEISELYNLLMKQKLVILNDI